MAGDLFAGEEDPVWAALIEKAEFCLTTGIQPSEYDNMTDDERAAFVTVANRQAAKNRT